MAAPEQPSAFQQFRQNVCPWLTPLAFYGLGYKYFGTYDRGGFADALFTIFIVVGIAAMLLMTRKPGDSNPAGTAQTPQPAPQPLNAGKLLLALGASLATMVVLVLVLAGLARLSVRPTPEEPRKIAGILADAPLPIVLSNPRVERDSWSVDYMVVAPGQNPDGTLKESENTSLVVQDRQGREIARCYARISRVSGTIRERIPLTMMGWGPYTMSLRVLRLNKPEDGKLTSNLVTTP